MHFPFKKKKKERPKETKEIKLSTSAIKFTMPKYSYSLQIYSNILLRTVNMYVIDIVAVPFIPNKNLITLICKTLLKLTIPILIFFLQLNVKKILNSLHKF